MEEEDVDVVIEEDGEEESCAHLELSMSQRMSEE